MTFQYFRKNLAYYVPIMLILEPKLQYFRACLQYVKVLKNQYGWRLCHPLAQNGAALAPFCANGAHPSMYAC